MLLAFYPPWVILRNPSAGGVPKSTHFGYASIWEPPPITDLPDASIAIDLQRLLLQDVGVLIPIGVLWFLTAPFRREMERAEAQENQYHGPEANQNLSRQLRVVLVLVALACLGSAFFLLKDYIRL